MQSNDWLSDQDLSPAKRILVKEEIVKRAVNVDAVMSGAAAVEELGKDRPFHKIGTATQTPLAGKTICIAGKLDHTNAEMKKIIEQLGGQLDAKVSGKVTHLVCKQNEWTTNRKKPNSKCNQAKKLDIAVMSAEWIDEAKSKLAIIDESKYVIGGSKRATKLIEQLWSPGGANGANTPKKEEEKKVKLVMKGRAAIDPLAGQDYIEKFHVLDHGGSELFNVVLNVTDITSGTNSYYGLQVLESDQKNKWALFRKWGRVGTNIGSCKTEDFGKKETAITEFRKLYLDKTGNDWSERDRFEKKPGKFFPIQIDYGNDDDDGGGGKPNGKPKGKRMHHDAKSKLDKRVQDFVSLIFDIKLMEQALVEMEIDLKKMPLGKLSKAHIENGMDVLRKIGDVLSNRELAEKQRKNQLLALNNQFYTLIPHDFGTEKVKLIDSDGQLKEKVDLMQALIDMEIATSFMKETDEANGSQSVIDQEYDKLKTELVPLEKDNAEFQMCAEYLMNQKAGYKLKLIDVFKSERQDEQKRFDNSAFAHHNRQLLWHGSRLTNYVGILSQGLRIAPPEAPKSGYRFGKGVYFADVCEKSAGYCRAAGTDALIMMLCEVAIGDEKELLRDQYMEQPLPGSHSTKAMGGTAPDPKSTIVFNQPNSTLNGCTVPLGKPVKTGIKSSCTHNEYIIYSVEQVRIRYVLRLTLSD